MDGAVRIAISGRREGVFRCPTKIGAEAAASAIREWLTIDANREPVLQTADLRVHSGRQPNRETERW